MFHITTKPFFYIQWVSEYWGPFVFNYTHFPLPAVMHLYIYPYINGCSFLKELNRTTNTSNSTDYSHSNAVVQLSNVKMCNPTAEQRASVQWCGVSRNDRLLHFIMASTAGFVRRDKSTCTWLWYFPTLTLLQKAHQN